MKLFVDTDSDRSVYRLARRVPRDIKERGRDLDYVLNQYMNFVKPVFEEFCLPTKKFADVIIPRGADNTVAIDLIVHHIWDIMHLKNLTSPKTQPGSIHSSVGVLRPHPTYSADDLSTSLLSQALHFFYIMLLCMTEFYATFSNAFF